MLWSLRIAGDAVPRLSTVDRRVNAALVGGPELSGLPAGADQRCDGGGWVGPSVADPLPASAVHTAIQPAIRAPRRVGGMRSGGGRDESDVRISRIGRHA